MSECGQFRPRMASSCVNDCPTCSPALQTPIRTIIYDYSSYSNVTCLLVAPSTNTVFPHIKAHALISEKAHFFLPKKTLFKTHL